MRVGGNDVVFHLDQGHRPPRRLGVLRHHRGHAVPHVAHRAAEHPVVVRGGLRETLAGLAVRDIRAVPVIDHEHHAVQGFRPGGVDALDDGMGVRASKHDKDAASHLHPVFHVRLHAGDELDAVDLPGGLANDPQAVAENRRHGRGPRRVPAALSGQLHCQEELLVAGGPAEEPGKSLTDVFLGGRLLAAEQLLQEQRGARRVERGLDHPGVQHRFLQDGEVGTAAQALDRLQGVAFRLAGNHEPRQHSLAVQEDGVAAGKSLPVVTAAHGGDADALEKHLQALSRFGGYDAALAVERKADTHELAFSWI